MSLLGLVLTLHWTFHMTVLHIVHNMSTSNDYFASCLALFIYKNSIYSFERNILLYKLYICGINKKFQKCMNLCFSCMLSYCEICGFILLFTHSSLIGWWVTRQLKGRFWVKIPDQNILWALLPRGCQGMLYTQFSMLRQ